MLNKKELEEMKKYGAIVLADKEPSYITKLPDLKIEISCDDDVKEIRRYIEEQKQKERHKEACRRARKETFWYVMSVVGIALLISAMLALFVGVIVAGYTGQLTVDGHVVPDFVGIPLVLPLFIPFVIFSAICIRKWLEDE